MAIKKYCIEGELYSANAIQKIYHDYPEFAEKLSVMDEHYNSQCDELDILNRQDKVFVIAPSQPVHVKRLEGDLQKLLDLYHLGYQDMEKEMSSLYAYLGIKDKI